MEPEPMESQPLVVDTVPLCSQVCRLLAAERMLALDLEGVGLGREGRIAILQIATRTPVRVSLPVESTAVPADASPLNVAQLSDLLEKTTLSHCEVTGKSAEASAAPPDNATRTIEAQVFLFDISTLKDKAFKEGLLGAVLQNRAVVKLMYDLRKDCDALFHIFGVTVENVLDAQILFYCKFLEPKSKGNSRSGRGNVKRESQSDRHFDNRREIRVCGFAKACERALKTEEVERIKAVKQRGLLLFAPEKGGSYEVWEQRPLAPDLVTYCAEDVVSLFAMHDSWLSAMALKKWRDYSAQRRDRTVQRQVQWSNGSDNWMFPDWR